MRNQRLIRINDEIQRVSAEVLRDGLSDPRVQDVMITVTKVATTEDLSHTTISVSIMGDEEAKEEAMEGLNSAKGFIRSELAHGVDLRRTPEVHFELDETLDQAMKIDKLLREVKENDKGAGLDD